MKTYCKRLLAWAALSLSLRGSTFCQLVAALILLSGAAQAQWLAGYDHRKSLAINAGVNAGTGYQIQVRVGESSGAASFDLHLEGKALNFPNDVRFTDDDGTTNLDHWLESTTGSAPNRTATFWVEVNDNLNSSQSILTYYRRSAGTSGSNADATFNFYDDFNGGAIDGAKWIIDNATGWSVSGGELRGTNTSGRIRSQTAFNSGVILESKYRSVTRPGNGNMVLGFWASTSDSFGWLNHPGGDFMRVNTAWTSIGNECRDNIPVIARMTARATQVDMLVTRQDTGAIWHNRTNNNSTVSNERIALGNRYDNGNTNQTYNAFWDWVRVRKNADTLPTLGAAGPERTNSPIVTLTSPTNGIQVVSGSSATATATVTSGIPPYSVQFFRTFNGGGAVSAGTDNTEPYSIDLGVLANGNYTIYAAVTDSATPTPSTVNSATHSFTVAPDTTPPSPNPMTFVVNPVPISLSAIRMAATTATDVVSPAVQYYFENTTNATNSGWISSPIWTDNGLTLGTSYGYRVKARDSATPPNETGFSAIISASPGAPPGRPITLINPGFEIPILEDGISTSALPGWLPVGDVVLPAAWNPTVSFYASEAPEGRNIGDVYLSPAYSGFSQILQGAEGQFQANATYDLKVNVGRNLQDPYDGYIIQLLANGSVIAQDDNSSVPAAGSFVTSSIQYSYNASLHSGLVGFPLEIRLLSKGLAGGAGDINFDDVRINYATPDPVAIHGGPYRLSLNAPLTINGSASIPSPGATITSYEWDLDSRNDHLGFTANATGATPAAIPYATLTGTYGMTLGVNTIRLRVTDNAGLSTISTATVTLFSLATYLGPDTSRGQDERWNVASNWTGTAVPSGLVDVLIPANKAVPCLSSLTPSFTGNLTMGSNSQISVGWTSAGPAAYNAMGTPGQTVITMNSGSSFSFRIGGTPIIPGIVLAGNASVTLGSSTGSGAQASFNHPISGPFRLSFNGNRPNECIANLNAPNTFSELYTAGGPYVDGGVTLVGNAPGSFGSGNITLTALGGGGNSGLVIINAADSMADTATLSMDGNTAVKITMNANDTIARLVINGVQLPAGTYGSTTSTAIHKQTWIAGTGILTVTDGLGSFWDRNGATAGAGGASPSGTWDSSALWSNSPAGTAATAGWISGGSAVFAAGSDATGPYTVSVAGPNDITVTNTFSASSNTGTSNFSVTRTGWALNSGNCVVVLLSSINATGFTATYAGQPMIVQGVVESVRNVYTGIAYLIGDSLPSSGDVVINAPRVGTAANGPTGGYANMGTTYSILSLSNVATPGTAASRLVPGNPPSTSTLSYTTSTNSSFVVGVSADGNWRNSPKTVTGRCSQIIIQGQPGYANFGHFQGQVAAAGTYTDVYNVNPIAMITLPLNAKTTPNPLLAGAGQKISGLQFEEGTVTINGDKLEMQSTSVMNSASGVTATLASQITGVATAGITKKGPGNLVLSNATNNYTGTTTITDGTLRLGATDAVPNTALSIAGEAPGVIASFDLNGFNDTVAGLTFGGASATSGASLITGAGTLTLSGNVVYSSLNAPLGATLDGNLSLGAATRTFLIGDSLTAANDLTVSAIVSGTGGLTKSGFGTLRLSGNNAYTGPTTVSSGLLILSGSNNSAATGGITVNNSGEVRFDSLGSIAGTGANVTIQSGGLAFFDAAFGSGNIPAALARINPASTGVVAADNFGTTAFNFATNNLNAYLGALGDVTYIGSITPSGGSYRIGGGRGTITLTGVNALNGTNSLFIGGRVVIANSNNLSGATTINTTGRLQIGAGGTLGSLNSSTLTNNGMLAFNRSDLLTQGTNFWGTISGSGIVEQAGSGTVVLNANNNYSGGTNLLAGTLRLGHANAIGSGPLAIYSGALDTVSALTLASNNPITLGGSFSFGGTANLNMGTGGVSITGDHTILLNGTNRTLTLGGVMTNVSGGNQTTTVNGAGNSLVLGGLSMSSDIYATGISITIGGSGNVSITGAVQDWSVDELDVRFGSLTKIGSGTLTLSGNNNYTGNTVVSGGVLHLAGGTQISPIIVNSGGTLAFTLGSTITTTERLTLNGGHKIRIVGTPTADSYTLMIADSIVGGAPVLETPIPLYFLEVAGNELRLTKNDQTAPILVDITNDQGSGINVGPMHKDTMVTYTVTFNEDINHETVTAVDFANAAVTSPSSFSIGTIMEISPGVFTVQVTPTSVGNLQLSIPPSADIRDLSNNLLDSIPAIVDESIIGVVDPATNWLVGTDIEDDQGGEPVNEGAVVIYTIYFGRDIDHTTVDASDFGNAGTCSLTIGAITETSPGVVTVHVTPTSTGNLRFQVNAGAVLKDTANNSLNTSTAIVDDTTISIIDANPPTLAATSIVDNKGGGPVAINGLVSYTVTFSEDMDDSTVTAADFGNAGSATASIGLVTEIAAGVFNVQVTPTSAGTLQLRVNEGAVLKDAAGNELLTIPVILDDTTITVDAVAPTLSASSIVDDRGGASIGINSPVLYTVTFSEDMDASSVTAADFGNAGSCALTIGTVTETTPGVFTVQATPTNTGTLRLRVNANAVLKDVAGNNLNTTTAIADDTTITVDGTAPTLAATAIVDNKGGGPVSINTLVTYTVSFSEDMDASTVTAADFGNAGSSALTIGTITETTPGVFSVQATPTTAGTLQLRVNAGAVLKDVAGNNLNTTSAIADNTTLTVDGTVPTLAAASIVDNKSGGPVSINTLVTYTLTFSEDMDASSVTAADFGNAGTSALTIGTITETTPGVFTVQGTPTTVGTLQLRVNAGAVLKDVAGNNLNTTTAIADDTTITVETTPPTLVATSFVDNRGGVPIAINSPVTYTVTFSEDMDASTVTAADFGNAGTATLTIGTVSETSPGVFSVPATPTTTGTLRLRVNAGAVLKDVAGNNLNTTTAIADDTTITVDATVPTLATTAIVDNKGGSPISVNTLVTYTLTFSEDMDASTVTAADFGNAGSSTLTIGTITETAPGVFTVQATPIGAGTLRLRVNTGAVLKDVAGNNLNTTAAIVDDTTITVDGTVPTLAAAAIVDNKAGGPVSVNTLVTYTLTFSEDMDASTVSAADFGNAGSSTLTIGTITETTPGVFTVQATPTTAGTLQLRVNAGAVLKDVAGNNLNTTSAIVDNTTLIVDGTLPTLAASAIVDNKNGGPVSVNTLVTYTLTFSEDMDASSVTAADFGNAGSSALTIGTITETTPGVFSVQATPTTSGNLQLRVNADAVLKDVAGNNLNTNAAIADDTTITVDGTPPTLAAASIVDNKNGGPVSINSLVTYTVTFSEDMDASTVTAADFGNAGTSILTIGTVTETTPGVFTVQATPTTIGTLRLRVNAGAVLKDVVGNNLNTTTAIADDTTITIDGTVPTLATTAIVDDKSGGRITPNTLVTYTLTFSEDMDASSVTAADFGNAGTSILTIGAVTETAPGVFTVQATPSLAGTLRLRVNAGAVLKDVAGNNLNTTTAIADDTTLTVDGTVPTLATTAIVDNKNGARITPNTLVTYTLTFSEDMDASSVTAADFGNAGTSALTIGAVTETTPGVFTVQATPTTAGTLQLRVNAGAVLKDVAGNNLNTTAAILDNTTLTVDGTVPTLATTAIVDNKSGARITPNTLVTYTLTFSEDMDASSVTAADFGNAGTSILTIGAVTETTPGVFTVQATPTTAGTLQLRVNAAAVLKDVAGNNLNTTAAIADNTILTVDGTVPTLATTSIVDNKSGARITPNTLVTYTVTFSEDMDASSVTAADFGNAGTSILTVGAVTETTPGVFTVQATPTTAGTLQLRVNAGAVLKDVAGNNLNTTAAIADNTILTVDGTVPTLAATAIVDNKSGGRITPNTLVTYTLTFSEDMDASSVTAADFGNAGTSTLTIGAVTETTPGVFTVQATPIGAGTLRLRVNASAVLKDVAGNNLNTSVAILDDTTLTVDGTVPTLATTAIVDNKGGARITPNTLVTYTVTFSEDMDASSVTAADFGNGGTSTLTIGAVTETTPGKFTVQATPTIAGTLRLRVNAGAILKDVAGNNLNTTAAILDNTTLTVDGTVPTLAATAIVDNKGGNPIARNTLVTYTLTFSEDMNASTVTAADFGNAGTSSITFGTIAEPTPGKFTIQVTPTTAGTLRLRVNAGAVLKDVAGNNLNTTSAILDNTTITVRNTLSTLAASSYAGNLTPSMANAYSEWAGKGNSFYDDLNGDGFTNGLAWLLNATDPNENAKNLLRKTEDGSGAITLAFVALDAEERGAASLKVQFSKDRGITDPWTDHEAEVPGKPGISTINGITFHVKSIVAGLLQVEATIPAGDGKPLYSRLRASAP